MNEKTLLYGALAFTTVAAGFGVWRARQSTPSSVAITPVSRIDATRTVSQAEVPIRLTASDGTGLRLDALTAKAAIEDPLALTELHLVFENPENRVLEGTFRITLPQGASLSRFAMKVGEVWQEGEVVEKQAARQAYEDFLHRRQDPALMEQGAGNEFSARVFPIPARGRKEIIVSYSEVLEAGAPYTLPLRGLPMLGSLDVDVHAAGSRVADATFGVHQTHFTPGQDFVVEGKDVPRSAGLRAGDLAIARVVPFTSSRPEPVASAVVMVDTSASRGLGIADQARLVKSVLSKLPENAPVTVACFDQEVVKVYEGKASGFGDKEVSAIVARGALGASDFEQAIAWAAGEAKASKKKRVVFVGDGVATAGEIDAQKLKDKVQALRDAGVDRMDAIAVGGIRDDAFFRTVVRGVLDRDGVVLDGKLGGEALARRLGEATSSGVPIKVDGARWSWPEKLDGLQAGDEVMVFAEIPAGAPVKVTVGTQTIAPDLRTVDRPLVERAWAQAKIQSMIDAPTEDAATTKRKIIELSTQHRVMSPYTAMLVLETDSDYRRFNIDRNANVDILTVDNGRIALVHEARDFQERLQKQARVEQDKERAKGEAKSDSWKGNDGDNARLARKAEAEAAPSASAGTATGALATATAAAPQALEQQAVTGQLQAEGQGRGASGADIPPTDTSALNGHFQLDLGGAAAGNGTADEATATTTTTPTTPAARPAPGGGGEIDGRFDRNAPPPPAAPRPAPEPAERRPTSTPQTEVDYDGIPDVRDRDPSANRPSGGHRAPAQTAAPSRTRAPGPSGATRADPAGESIQVRPGTLVVHGGISDNEAQRVLRSSNGALRTCYASARSSDRALHGRVTADVVVDAVGSVKTANVTDSPSPALKACVETTIKSLRFPAPGTGDASFTTSFDFVSSGSGSGDDGDLGNIATGPSNVPQAVPYEGRFKTVMEDLARGDKDGALDEAKKWHDDQPGDVLSLVALGEATEAKGDLHTAARAYGSILELFSFRADSRRFAGERLERLNDPSAQKLAIDTYKKAVEQRPDHPASHRLYAYSLLKHGEYDKAFEALKKGASRTYPVGRFAGVDRILKEDLGIIAAAWAHAEPARRGEIMTRLHDAHGTEENAPSLRFVLVWETDANDVDFHIYDARGGHAYYGSKQLPSGGELYADVTTGYGPECFTIRNAPGARVYPYVLQAHYYSRGPMGYGMGKLEIIDHDGKGGLKFEERPFVVMKDRAYVDMGRVDKSKSDATALLK